MLRAVILSTADRQQVVYLLAIGMPDDHEKINFLIRN